MTRSADEITRLNAEVERARADALEEAAKVAEEIIAGRHETRVIPAHYEKDDYGEVMWRVPKTTEQRRVIAFGSIPAAIRALILKARGKDANVG